MRSGSRKLISIVIDLGSLQLVKNSSGATKLALDVSRAEWMANTVIGVVVDVLVCRAVDKENVCSALVSLSIGSGLNFDLGGASLSYCSSMHMIHQLVPVTNF